MCLKNWKKNKPLRFEKNKALIQVLHAPEFLWTIEGLDWRRKIFSSTFYSLRSWFKISDDSWKLGFIFIQKKREENIFLPKNRSRKKNIFFTNCIYYTSTRFPNGSVIVGIVFYSLYPLKWENFISEKRGGKYFPTPPNILISFSYLHIHRYPWQVYCFKNNAR